MLLQLILVYCVHIFVPLCVAQNDISISVPPFSNSCDSIYQTEIAGQYDSSLLHQVDSKVVIFGTRTPQNYITLYRTTDGGATWENLNSKMTSLNLQNTRFYPYFLRIGILDVVWSDSNPALGYITGTSGQFWVTKDGGDTFSFSLPRVLYNYLSYNSTFEWYSVYPHPNIDGLVVASSYSPFCFRGTQHFQPAYCPIYTPPEYVKIGMSLSYSTDYGQTWTNIWTWESLLGGSFTWGLSGKPGYPAQMAFGLAVYNQDYIRIQNSSNFFRDFTLVTPADVRALTLVYDPDFGNILIGGVQYNQFNLYVLSPNGTFTMSRFPTTDTTSIVSINFLDASEGAVFVAIARANSQTNERADLYVSDLEGSDFTLSLHDLSWDGTRVKPPVFVRLKKIEGIYLCNSWEGTNKKTKITYDKGGEWWLLNPPAAENCTGCNLHLWGSVTVNPAFDVKTAGFGIIIANGNVGTVLQGDALVGNLYFSRDAGRTWTRIMNGTRIFDVSDYGELITGVSWDAPTNKLEFTRDQGITWDSCLFDTDNTRFSILSLHQNLGTLNNSAWVFASYTDESGLSSNMLIFVNLSIPLPACQPADYEDFNPHGSTQNCILGQAITFTRKKQASLCIADPAVLNRSNVETCPCARSDYYCVYCYVSNTNRTCVRDVSNSACLSEWVDAPASCTPGATYTLLPPYRKVSGSLCVGSVSAYEAPLGSKACPLTPRPAPGAPPPPIIPAVPTNSNLIAPSVTGWIIFGVLLGVVVISLAVFIVYRFVLHGDEVAFSRLDEEPQSPRKTLDENDS